MAIITLLTDFGSTDWHVAALKGTIERVIPGTSVVDISHNMGFGSAQQVALILRYTWPHFPPNTIHFISVDAAPSAQHPFVAIKYGGQYFLGKDDGILTMMLNGEKPEICTNIHGLLNNSVPNSFAARDLFVKVAAFILSGNPLHSIGSEYSELNPKLIVSPTYSTHHINGSIIYTDHWGNVITNISLELFNRISAGRRVEIRLKRPSNTIRKIFRSYSEVNDGDLIAIFNSVHHLEIAINKGSASRYCGLEVGDQVLVEFFD